MGTAGKRTGQRREEKEESKMGKGVLCTTDTLALLATRYDVAAFAWLLCCHSIGKAQKVLHTFRCAHTLDLHALNTHVCVCASINCQTSTAPSIALKISTLAAAISAADSSSNNNNKWGKAAAETFAHVHNFIAYFAAVRLLLRIWREYMAFFKHCISLSSASLSLNLSSSILNC